MGVRWAVKMDSWWLGGCADKVQPGSPTLHSQPHANPSSPWPLAWVQLTPFYQGSQASCVRAKGLIKYLAVN